MDVMDDSEEARSPGSPEVSEDCQTVPTLHTVLKESMEDMTDKEIKNEHKCLNFENGHKNGISTKIFKTPVKEKLRFGIEAILNVKEGHKSDKSSVIMRGTLDKIEREDRQFDVIKRHVDDTYMDSMLSKDDDVNDDSDALDADVNDLKDYKFDLDVARARLTYMGFQASFSHSGLPEAGGISLQQSSFSPPFPVNTSGYPWTAVGDLRKDRFPSEYWFK